MGTGLLGSIPALCLPPACSWRSHPRAHEIPVSARVSMGAAANLLAPGRGRLISFSRRERRRHEEICVPEPFPFPLGGKGEGPP